MIGAARILAAMDTRRRDLTGFTNMDREFGRRVANIVEIAGEGEPRALQLLAWLVGGRYRRQTEAMFNADQLREIDTITPDEVTTDDRAWARSVITVFPSGSDHVLIGWQENSKFPASVAIGREVRAFPATRVETERGTMFELHAGAAQPLLLRLRSQHFTVVTTAELEQTLERRVDRRIGAAPKENLARVRLDGDQLLVMPPPNAAYIALVRAIPGRSYNPETKEWSVSLHFASDLKAKFETAGADVAQFDALALPDAPKHLATIGVLPAGSRFALVFPYDRPLIAATRALPGAEYSGQQRAWRIPRLELRAFARLLDKHPVPYDRTEVDAALTTLRPVPPDPIVKMPTSIARHDHPSDFAKPYQLEGIAALCQPLAPLRESLGESVRGFLLGDQRGLGKTMEAACAAELLAPPDAQMLVIANKSFRRGWRAEIRSWIGPNTEVELYRGGKFPGCRWVIANYAQLPQIYEQLRTSRIYILIVDEAHRIKNMRAIQSRYVAGNENERDPEKSMEGLVEFVDGRVFLLTGTPLPNRARDGFNYLRAIGHPLGQSFRRYGLRYCAPLEEPGFGMRYDGSSNIAELRRRMEPVMIARRKQDVLPQLPPKTRRFLPVDIDLTEYRKVLSTFQARDDARRSDSSRTLAFLTAARMATAFTMIPYTIEQADDAIRDGEKVIIFSGSTQVLDQLAAHFGKLCVQHDGRKTERQREQAEQRFNDDPNVRLFLGQWETAGESLNLTAATQIIFNELDWVPKTMLQAEDRSHRVTTTEPVNITYMVANNTIVMHIARTLEQKMEMINEFEGAGESFFHELADAVRDTLAKGRPVHAGEHRLSHR
jgi:SWI/SNF-related matrix-associated actin-dependent regulator 1 of chromatin subfamily A